MKKLKEDMMQAQCFAPKRLRVLIVLILLFSISCTSTTKLTKPTEATIRSTESKLSPGDPVKVTQQDGTVLKGKLLHFIYGIEDSSPAIRVATPVTAGHEQGQAVIPLTDIAELEITSFNGTKTSIGIVFVVGTVAGFLAITHSLKKSLESPLSGAQ